MFLCRPENLRLGPAYRLVAGPSCRKCRWTSVVLASLFLVPQVSKQIIVWAVPARSRGSSNGPAPLFPAHLPRQVHSFTSSVASLAPRLCSHDARSWGTGVCATESQSLWSPGLGTDRLGTITACAGKQGGGWLWWLGWREGGLDTGDGAVPGESTLVAAGQGSKPGRAMGCGTIHGQPRCPWVFLSRPPGLPLCVSWEGMCRELWDCAALPCSRIACLPGAN